MLHPPYGTLPRMGHRDLSGGASKAAGMPYVAVGDGAGHAYSMSDSSPMSNGSARGSNFAYPFGPCSVPPDGDCKLSGSRAFSPNPMTGVDPYLDSILNLTGLPTGSGAGYGVGVIDDELLPGPLQLTLSDLGSAPLPGPPSASLLQEWLDMKMLDPKDMDALQKELESGSQDAFLHSLEELYLDDGALAGSHPAVLRALHLIEEMGPALGLHVNLAKCEIFSRKGNTSFPPDVRCSLLPNLDILGAPIGDYLHCSKFIAGKCAESRKCCLGWWMWLQRISRVTPPSLASDALRSFDEEVQQCFALCTAIEVPNGAWCQAQQLGLKCGGLGLRSVSLHAAAAFMASLSSSGFGSADYIHLQQAVVAINSQVSLPNAISVISVLGSPTRTQKWSLHLVWACTFESNEYQMAIKCWLGLDTSGQSMCSFCPDTALDPLGHHAVTCRHGHAHLCVRLEKGNGLTRDLDHTRPADILIAGWVRGKPAALDITITSPLCPAILDESCHQTGAAILAAETRKLHSNGPKCQELGWSCIPLAVETYGNWGKEAQDTISRLASDLAIHQSSTKSSVVAEIYGRLNMTLIRSIARAILARELPHPPNCLSTLKEASIHEGAAALAAETRKHAANDARCQALGWSCIPLAVETFGNWGKEARCFFSRLATLLALRKGHSKSTVVNNIYGCLNLSLVSVVPTFPSMIVTVDRSAEEAATLLPSLEDVFQISTPTLHHVPANALPAFASVLSQALRSVIHDNTMEAWIKLLLLPKCCLPSAKRKGRHHKPIDIKMLCDLWSRGQFGVLWRLAICHSKVGSATKSCNKSLRPRHKYAISLAQDGLYSKACQVLTSSGIAPNTPQTWKLLESKHPQGPIPTHPKSFDLPVNIPYDLDIMAILRFFSKLTAAGPSGMRVQHLLDAATVPLPTSILSSLRHVANLLAVGKAPKELSIYLSGATLTALSKNKSNCPPDVRPIAVGEVLRRLTSKCVCHLIKHKAAEFFHSFQFGVACPRGAEIILHSLRCCFDDHWADNNFVVLKVDMTNAFNLVSRQAVLDECAQHFPELLAWAS
ncbi:hypothetical protein EMCRGX_G024759 [Ephydatia muelleri]